MDILNTFQNADSKKGFFCHCKELIVSIPVVLILFGEGSEFEFWQEKNL